MANMNNAYRAGNSGMNGYAQQQQAVWSPSAFGTGYGYSKSAAHPQGVPSLDQKSGASMSGMFSATPGKEMYGSGDYRGFQAQGHGQPNSALGGYGMNPNAQLVQSPTVHNFGAAAAAAAAYNRNNVVSTAANAYGYYGAPGQASAGRGGRFGGAAAQTGNGDYYGGMGSMEGGYYGGLGGGYAYGQSPAQGQSGHNQGSQRKMWGV
jgi:hypothetical protein